MSERKKRLHMPPKKKKKMKFYKFQPSFKILKTLQPTHPEKFFQNEVNIYNASLECIRKNCSAIQIQSYLLFLKLTLMKQIN